MPVSSDDFKRALGSLPAGVVVLTSTDLGGAFVGATVSAFMSLSLDPPLVLGALDARSRTAAAIRAQRRFVAHIIAKGHEALAFRFASSAADKFEGIAHGPNENGLPLIDVCPVKIECDLYDERPGGDHTVVIGQVERVAISQGDWAPLVWHDRSFHRLADTFGEDVRATDNYGQFASWLLELPRN